MSNSPLPPDVPETIRRGDQVLTISGSMPRSGQAGLPQITLTESQQRPESSAADAKAPAAAAEGATRKWGGQTLTISGSMPRTGQGLPGITLDAQSAEVIEPDAHPTKGRNTP